MSDLGKVGITKAASSSPPVRVDYDMVTGKPVYVTGRDRVRAGHTPTWRERIGGYGGRGLGAASAFTGQHKTFNSFMNALLMGWDRGKHLGQAAGRFFVTDPQQERANIRGRAREGLRTMEAWDDLSQGEQDTSRFGWRSKVPFYGRRYQDPKVAEFLERQDEERRRDARRQYAPEEEWERLMQSESFINEMAEQMGITPEEFRQTMGDFISTASEQGIRMDPNWNQTNGQTGDVGVVDWDGSRSLGEGGNALSALPEPTEGVAVRDDSRLLPAPSSPISPQEEQNLVGILNAPNEPEIEPSHLPVGIELPNGQEPASQEPVPEEPVGSGKNAAGESIQTIGDVEPAQAAQVVAEPANGKSAEEAGDAALESQYVAVNGIDTDGEIGEGFDDAGVKVVDTTKPSKEQQAAIRAKLNPDSKNVMVNPGLVLPDKGNQVGPNMTNTTLYDDYENPEA